jgi:hypothetical protein
MQYLLLNHRYKGLSVFTEKTHRNIYAGALTLLAISMPFSKFVMSVSQLILILNWLLEGNFKNRLAAFFQNKVALAVTSVFFFHLLAMLYTSDFNYGWEDIRKKLPILVLPLVLSTSPALSRKQFLDLLKLFILAVFTGTLISMAVLYKIIPHHVGDIRDISIFISHIRFSLMICLCIFFPAYLSRNEKPLLKILLYLMIAWFIIFLVILESMTGLIITFTVTLVSCLYFSLRQPQIKYKLAGVFVALLITGICFWFFSFMAEQYQSSVQRKPVKIETYTASNNLYVSDTLNTQTENGNPVWINVCEKELNESWNQRSSLDYNGRDNKGNELKHTLIRFLASKGLNKDAAAVNSLNNDEIRSVENGMANVNFQDQSSLTGRIHELSWEIDQYRKGGNPSGHSLVQRFEFWKAALGIIKENPVLGVGTGDAKIAYAEQYKKINSPLDEAHRLRAHNQFLAVTVATGVIGLIVFLFSLFYPLLAQKKYKDYYYLVFFVIVFISMFTEDTLETQAGITFFTFFNSLLLFASPAKMPAQKNSL